MRSLKLLITLMTMAFIFTISNSAHAQKEMTFFRSGVPPLPWSLPAPGSSNKDKTKEENGQNFYDYIMSKSAFYDYSNCFRSKPIPRLSGAG